MKHSYIILIILFCFLFCVACGGQDAGEEQSVEYQDVLSDSQSVFFEDSDDTGAFITLGIQFYGEDAIQLRGLRKTQDTERVVDVYQYKSDGKSELLLQNISEEYIFGDWYMDSEGDFYCCFLENIVKLDKTGKELFRKSLQDIGIEAIRGICQLKNGNVYVTYQEGNAVSEWTLGVVDASSGNIAKVNEVRLKGMGYIGAGEEGLLYMDGNGVWEIDVEDGTYTKIMMFGGSSYLLKEDPEIKAFSVLEDNSVKIMRCEDRYDNDVTAEILCLTDLGDEKTVLTLRGGGIGNSPMGKWLREQIYLFNQENLNYRIVLEECEYEGDEEEFARQTSIQIATGKGPDIIFGDVLDDYIHGMIQKGAFVDLSVYMAQSGIKEEDYFPAAFDGWREGEKIYGINVKLTPEGYRISEEILAENKVPDVETLVDSLLAWQEPAIYMISFDSQMLLEHLLQGTENLWGMIDWEKNTCNFDVELFTKILKVAKKYGYSEKNNYSSLVEDRTLENLLGFDTLHDQTEERMVISGLLFDDGCYPFVDSVSSMMAINSNSVNVEGAWEFISFLLSEERQATLSGSNVAVHREALMTRLQKDISDWEKWDAYSTIDVYENGAWVIKYTRPFSDINDKKIAEYVETIEETRALPIRTEPILDIIKEEAAHYFADVKNIADVVAVIDNRVQLYLDENKY